MKCEQAEALVAAYADGEVAGLSRHSIEKHLRTCARCAAKHAEVLALRARLRAEIPYFAPPPGLRERMLPDNVLVELGDDLLGHHRQRHCTHQ